MSWDISQFLKGLAEADEAITKSVEGSVAQFGEHIIGKAQRLAPISPSKKYIKGKRKKKIINPRYTGHSGQLKNSATVGEVTNDGNRITCEIGFNTEYAAAVHERLNDHHDQGQAKYLETPMKSEARKLVPFVTKRLP